MGRFKRWLMLTFFKKELRDFEKYYINRLNRIENNSKKDTQQLDIVHHIFTLYRNKKIVGESKNKIGQDLFIVEDNHGSVISYQLYGGKYGKSSFHPVLEAKFIEKSEFSPAHVEIIDILTKDDNIGNGSILMPYLFKHCREIGAEYIYGKLSPVDRDHFDRSEYFYKKHGFEVNFNEDRSSGKISKRIDDYVK